MTDLGIAIGEEEEIEEEGETAASTNKPRISMRKAVNEHCRSCIYDPLDKGGGTWRMQVENCTVTKCALYEIRPKSKPKKAE